MSYNIIYPDTSSDKIVEMTFSNKSTLAQINNPSAKSTIKDIKLIKDDSSSQKLEITDADEYPKRDESLMLKLVPKISFSDDIKEKMFHNKLFRNFISELENGLFLFTEMSKISFEVKIYFQQDWEVKNQKNIISLIKFYNISFNEELIIWENLSHFIGKNLKMSEFQAHYKELSKSFSNYYEKFYIKLDLN